MNWKQPLNFGQNEVIGLDIGSSSVKIVRLSKNITGYSVTAAGMVNIADSKEDGSRRDINIVRAIRKCLEMTRVQTRFAVCGVCGPEVAVREFEFPSLAAEEVEGAVRLEAAQVCPFNINIKDGTVDYQLTATNGEKTAGVMVAATNLLIKNKLQLVKDTSLECVLMDVDGLALLNCFMQCEKPEAGRTIAILNVGSSYTTLALTAVRPEAAPFIRDMAYAGDEIVKHIAAGNNMSAEDVLGILCGDSTDKQPELHDSMARACNKLIVDVVKTSQYYKIQGKSAALAKIYVCGGFSLVRGFVDLLNSQLPVKAVLWNPFEKIQCKAGQWYKQIVEKNGPAMAVAAGLSMRSI